MYPGASCIIDNGDSLQCILVIPDFLILTFELELLQIAVLFYENYRLKHITEQEQHLEKAFHEVFTNVLSWTYFYLPESRSGTVYYKSLTPLMHEVR